MTNEINKINEATMKQDWQDERKSDKCEGHRLANNAWCEKLYAGKEQGKTNMCGTSKNPVMENGPR